MPSQGEYSAAANALVVLIHQSIAKLPPWEQSFIPQDKIPAAAGAAAKVAVDAAETYRASNPSLTVKRNRRRR